LVLGSGIVNESESFWVRVETFSSFRCTAGKEVVADEGEVGGGLADLGVGEDSGKYGAWVSNGCIYDQGIRIMFTVRQ
jgi:hypothetical protein